MPLSSSDFLLYGSANMPADDVSTAGGAVALGTRVVFDDLPAAGAVRMVSTADADTGQTYAVSGKDGAGAAVSENFVLNGRNAIVGAQSFERIAKIAKTAGAALTGTAVCYRGAAGSAVDADSPSGQAVLNVADTSAFAVGMRVIVAPGIAARQEIGAVASIQAGVSITLTADLTFAHTAAQADAVHAIVAELPAASLAAAGAEVTKVKKVFEAVASQSTPQTFYEKVFFRNNHGVKTLSAAKVRAAEAPVKSSPATTVNADSARGSTTLYTAATTGFAVGDVVVIGAGTNRAECGTVASIDAGVSLTLQAGLLFDHTAAQADAVRVGKVAFVLSASRDDSGSVANRLTAPGGSTFAGDIAAVAGGVHPAGSAQGVWLRLSLPADDTAFAGSAVIEESGVGA
jgi:hypothetical protein